MSSVKKYMTGQRTISILPRRTLSPELRNIFLQGMATTTGTVCDTSFMNMRLSWQRKII